MSLVADGEEYDVLAYGLLLIRQGRGWPSDKAIARHMDWESRRASTVATLRLRDLGLIRRTHVGRSQWRPTDDALAWGVDNPRRLAAAQRREGMTAIGEVSSDAVSRGM